MCLSDFGIAVSQEYTEDSATRSDEFVELFTRHQWHVYYFIRSLIPNPNEADEVLQQTNLVLWKKFKDYESGSNFRAWACKIARFEVYSYRAKQRRAEMYFCDLLMDEIAKEAAENVEWLEERLHALRYCQEKLSTRDQDLLRRRYRPDGTSSCAAEELGRPVRSVYKSLSRIRKTLLECITRRLIQEDLM